MRRRILTGCSILALLCAGLLLATVRAEAAPARGEAWVVVFADLTNPTAPDEISFRIMNNTDAKVLMAISDALHTKFKRLPKMPTLVEGNEDFPEDDSVGATIHVPVLSSTQDYLPVAPFIEAFAPYASRVRLVFKIAGPFTYRGYIAPYADKNVSLTFDIPPLSPTKSPTPLAFYGVDVTIKNPSLTTISLPNHPEEQARTRHTRILLAAGLAVIILAIGLILALLLPRRKAQHASLERDSSEVNETPTGGYHG